MDHLECPSSAIWEERREWLESLNEELAGAGSYLISEQACALIAEVQSSFCVGAWVSVIVLSIAVVDAQLRETEIVGFKGNTKRLLDAVGADSKLQALRARRNALVHVTPGNPAITVDCQWEQRPQLEVEAREAIRLMFKVFYMSPGT